MRTVAGHDTAFVDLICQDEDLLRAEFDALVAASWHTPPPPPPAMPRPGDRPAGWPVPPAFGPPAVRAQAAPPGERFNRQRSPPPGRAVHGSRPTGSGPALVRTR